MIVTIKSIDQDVSTFHSEFGIGVAIWHGKTPKVNSVQHVEFDIKETLTWGVDIYPSDVESCTINMVNKKLVILGQLESVDEDGYTVVRLGNSIIPLDVQGITQLEPMYVKAVLNEVTLFPYEL